MRRFCTLWVFWLGCLFGVQSTVSAAAAYSACCLAGCESKAQCAMPACQACSPVASPVAEHGASVAAPADRVQPVRADAAPASVCLAIWRPPD